MYSFLSSHRVLLWAPEMKRIIVSCMWGRILRLSAANRWTCPETIYLCWKAERPFQRRLFGPVFPVVLCPLWELLHWGSIPWPLTVSLHWHNEPFVPTWTTAVGPGFVFSAIIHDPTPAVPPAATSLERNAIQSKRNAVKQGPEKRLAGIWLWCW